MSRVEYTKPRTVRVGMRLPLFIHEEHTLRSPKTGALIYVHFVWATRRRWLRWAARRSAIAAQWHVTTLGPFVVAFGFDS